MGAEQQGGDQVISIHALREESDKGIEGVDRCWIISIHALREESDTVAGTVAGASSNFNPRSP